MTVAAVQLRVCTTQREIGLQIMIELPGPPVRRVVTDIALLAEAAAMRVVVNMAGHACAVRIAVGGRSMTLGARNRRMGSDQRKTRDVMVEPHTRRPAGRDVALGTAIAELTEVRIIAGMAGSAISW